MKLHIDIDSFFVSAHRIKDPSLRKVPVAVGGRSNLSIFENQKEQKHYSKVAGAFTSSILSSNKDKGFKEYFTDQNGKVRGIITTSSYEAREYGVKTAMSVASALRLCPNLKVIIPDYPLYHKLSFELKVLLEKEIPTVEQFSIDEFFGDLSGYIQQDDMEEFIKNLQRKIFLQTQLPVSIGASSSKWLAKLATNFAKPYGVRYIDPSYTKKFLKDIPIEEFPGIGKGYIKRLKRKGIEKLGEIESHKELFYSWGKPGVALFHRSTGSDTEQLKCSSERKSIGIGRTFDPIDCRIEIKRRIVILCRHICFIALKNSHNPTSYHLKIRYEYGKKVKQNISLNRSFSEYLCKETMINLFESCDIHKSHNIIQLNLTIAQFQKYHNKTMNLFTYDDDNRQVKLSRAMSKMREKFGVDIIKNANELLVKTENSQRIRYNHIYEKNDK